MTLITRQCFAIPTSSLKIVRSTERARRAPTGCASERQKRSDLICDRETSCPPASSPSPLFPPRRISTTFESTSFRTLFPTSLVFPPSRPSYLFFLFVISLVFPCCSRASSCAEFIPPAKYRVRLPISPPSSLLFSTSNHRSFRVQPRFFLFFIIYSDSFNSFHAIDPQHHWNRASSNPCLIFFFFLCFSISLLFFFYIPTILDKLLHELTAISNHFLHL